MEQIRNFVIISHVDHGKSTLADRFLELTGTVEARKMQPQYLDRMELEREKGITIKMQPVRMRYTLSAIPYTLNLIDTPGHADFTYEVSRALAAVEGAILLADASQGVQAQTVSNFHLARAEGLSIIPAINKIDLAAARIEETAAELSGLTGTPPGEILRISAKAGTGVGALLEAVIERIEPPDPGADPPAPARALIFDSHFDDYRGVIAHVRVVDGTFRRGERIAMLGRKEQAEIMELGYFSPELAPAETLGAGEIGYIATGLKQPDTVRVGDTVTRYFDISKFRATEPLPGYREPQPVVFASVYPEDAASYPKLADALKKIRLNDAAIRYEAESSDALGRGWRMGFLGLLHMEIVGERLKREYGLGLVFASPSVVYRIVRADGSEELAYSAARLPDAHLLREIQEPWVRLEVVTRGGDLGAVSAFLKKTRGTHITSNYLGRGRLTTSSEVPLSEILVNFSDALKSITAGFGSFSYEWLGWRRGDLVRLDVLVAGEREPALSQIVPREAAYRAGCAIVAKLKEILPRQLFALPIQSALGGRIIARETLPALKKDVTGYLYGGDRTRKMKLWQKQKRGKKRLEKTGRVRIPSGVFLELLKR